MLSLDDVKKIVKDLPVDEYDVSDDVSLVVYRVDSFEYNEQKQVNRHIDIELIFGDRYEIHEEENLFDYILSSSFHRLRMNLFYIFYYAIIA